MAGVAELFIYLDVPMFEIYESLWFLFAGRSKLYKCKVIAKMIERIEGVFF